MIYLTKNIYFGGALFSEMEQMYNQYIVDQIREKYGDKVNVYLPQENSAINDKSGFADSIAIANGDNEYLEKADILIGVLDGPVLDSGLAAEIGYFYSLNKPILGLYTDSRQGTYGNQDKIDALDKVAESQFSYINLYTVGLVKNRGQIVQKSEELVNIIGNYLE